jgi:hypothetical protein
MSNKRINIDSNAWGPKGWYFIDTVITSYPDNPTNEDKRLFKKFITSLKDVLPCEKCRYHYSEFLNENPLNSNVLCSRDSLVEWILRCHNNIRKIQNKSEITIDDFYDYYIKENNLNVNTGTEGKKNNKNNKNNNKNNNKKYIKEDMINMNSPLRIPSYVSLMALICIFIAMILLVMVKYKHY